MMLPDMWWIAGVAVVVVVGAPSAVLAWLLRGSKVPGGATAAGIVAGIFVGLMAGPGVLGRAQPAIFAALFEGGSSEMERLRSLESRQTMDRSALSAIRASPAALEELGAQHALARGPMEEELANARRERRGLLDLMLAGVAGLHLFAIAGVMVPSRARGVGRLARSFVETAGAPLRVGIVYAGLGAVVPGLAGLAFVPPGQALAFGLALTVPGVTLALRAPMLMACAMAAWVAGAIALILAWSGPATVMVAGLILGLLLAFALEGPVARRGRRVGVRVAMGVTLPAIAGMLASRVDVMALASAPGTARVFWFALVAGVLWSSDGRMLAIWAALRFCGWEGIRRRPGGAWGGAARGVNGGAGVAQMLLVVMVIPAAPETAAPVALIAGALAGAALVEVSRGARSWLARVIE